VFSFCYYQCILKNIERKCSCQFDPIKETELNICMTQQQTMCAASQYNVVYTDIFKYCGNSCPKECDSTEYSITTSSSDFPSDEYVKRLLNYTFIKRKYTENSSSELKSNLLSFSVYYSDLKYTEISQSPKYTLSDLISGIGGNMGKRILLDFFIFSKLI